MSSMPKLLNPALVFGLAVVAAPIIIHLINRNRYQTVSWGAYQLLAASFQIRARRIRLQEILVLLLRMLVLALFALGLCRLVVYHEGFQWGDPLTSNVILIDGSYSMGRETGDGPLFDKARKRAIQLIEGLRKGEDVSVVVVGRQPDRLSPKPEFEFEDVVQKIRDCKLEGQSADYVSAMELSLQILSETKNPVRRLFIISDYQNFGWSSRETAKWAYQKAAMEEADLKLSAYYLWEDVTPRRNFSISPLRLQGVSINTSEPARFAFSVKNHSARASGCSVVIEKDGRELERRELTLETGETREELLEIQFERPGHHVLTARVDSDFIPGDNTSWMAVTVLDSIPVLIVDGAYAEDFLRSGAAYFAAALDPELQSREQTPFKPKRIPTHLLAQEELRNYKAVVLADAGDLPAEAIARLERYVDHGGGLLVSCGENTQPTEMTRSLYRDGEGLLPVAMNRLRSVERDERPFSPFFPQGGTTLLPFLARDQGQRVAEILLNRFVECEVTKSDLTNGAQALAEVADRKPLLITKRIGKGRVVLWTSSLDVSWGNLPSQWVYVPLANHLMLYLSAEDQNENQVIQGDKLVATFPRASDTDTICVKRPDGEIEETPARAEGDDLVLDYSDTAQPGVYWASPNSDFEVEAKAFGVNIDLRESELQQMDEDFRELLAESFSMEFHRGYDAFKKTSIEEGTFDAWRWLILIALAALLLESYVTSRITEGQKIRPGEVREVGMPR